MAVDPNDLNTQQATPAPGVTPASQASAQKSLNKAVGNVQASNGVVSATQTPAQQKLAQFNAQQATNPIKKPKNAQRLEEEYERDKQQGNLPTDQTYPSDNMIQTANKAFSKISVGSGLAIAFIVLIVLIWLIIPTASGYTRLQLLWFTIIGQSKLTTDTQPTPGLSGLGTGQGPEDSQLTPDTNATNNNTYQPPSMNGVDFSALDMYGV